MKKPTLIVALFISVGCYAQIELIGKVMDSLGVPIEFANVVLTNAEGHIITGAITDIQGAFTLATNKGDYTLSVSFIGYIDHTQPLQLASNITLPTIILKNDPNLMDEVVITAQKPIIERKVDRLVFYVSSSSFLKGSDGIEVLSRAPRINVDNDNVSILGKDNVRVMINDRITTLSGAELNAYLQSLTAEDISKIEVITNPQAKYEAAGNTGIINIVLKKRQGNYYSGNVRAIYKPATYNAGEIIGSFNFKKDKLLLSSSVNRAKGFRQYLQSSTIHYPAQLWNYNNIGKREFNNLNGRLSIDYYLSKNTYVGVQYLGGLRKYPEYSNSKTEIYNIQNIIDSTLVSHNKSNDKNHSHSINSHFQTKLDTLGKKLSIDLDYYQFSKNENELFESHSPNIYQSKDNKGVNNINNLSGRIDFDLPLKYFDLQTGAKVSRIKNSSNIKNYNIINGIPIFNNEQSNEFEYTENNQAIYFSSSKEFNEKWEAQVGLRFEATQTNGYSKTLNETNKNNYTKLFPTFYLNYQLNKNNSFSLDYGKRIKRPYFFQLNPFRYNSDIYSYTEGNPLLKPSFIDNIEISHNYKGLLQSSIYYKKVENGFNQVTILHPDNIQKIIPKNYYNAHEFGITESISFKITSFWETSNDVYFYFLKATSIIPEVKRENEGFTAYLNTSNSFKLNANKTFFATLNYWYQFPEASDLDDANAYSQLDIGFKAMLFKKNLIVSLNGSDLLKTNRPIYTSYNSENIKTTFSNYYDNRRLNLSFTYRFGNTKIKGKNHKGSNQEEKGRTN